VGAWSYLDLSIGPDRPLTTELRVSSYCGCDHRPSTFHDWAARALLVGSPEHGLHEVQNGQIHRGEGRAVRVAVHCERTLLTKYAATATLPWQN